MLTVLRTVVDVQKVFNYSAQNALVVRCDSDAMALVEKLISDLDKPRNEVLIDVMVMQVSSTYSRQTGVGFGGSGISTAASFQPRPGITTPGSQAAAAAAATSTTSTTGTTTPTDRTPASALRAPAPVRRFHFRNLVTSPPPITPYRIFRAPHSKPC